MQLTERKVEILLVAAKLFKEKGFGAVSMRDMGSAMNIKAASIYNHIDSKQEILSLIIIEIAEEFTTVMNEIVTSNDSVISKLKSVIQLHIDITIKNPDSLACLNKEWIHLTQKNLTYFLKMRENYENNFRAIIKKGIENGELKNLNLDIMVYSMHATLRNLYLWYGKKKDVNPVIVKQNLTEILLKGFIIK